ncbi:hypothetical protein BGZ83_002927 [Gryganskiella cystojenkinii]|nr:hypothetical protein BGZ83_002927 [Gryganskiella cystojenkinii]
MAHSSSSNSNFNSNNSSSLSVNNGHVPSSTHSQQQQQPQRPANAFERSTSSLLTVLQPFFDRRGSAGSADTFQSGSTVVGSDLSLPKEKGNGSDDNLGVDAEGNFGDGFGASIGGGSSSMRSFREGGVSTFKTIASLVCVVGGTGTLGMPHAVSESGWLGSLIIVLALFMSAYTGCIIIDCLYLKTETRRTSYQEIARDAYGTVGHYFAYGTVAVNLFGCAILYMILSATLMEGMIRTSSPSTFTPAASTQVPLYICVAACTGFVWACLIFTKTMKEVALLSILGAVATVGVVLITIGVSIEQTVHGVKEVIESSHHLVNWSKMPLALATISFAYGGNVVYPHVEQSMKYPRSWNRAVWSALSMCFVMYMSIAVAGYSAYGDATLSPILRNLPRGTWSILANSLITIHVLLAGPILLTSLAMMFEESITKWYPDFERGSTFQQFLKRAIPRSIIILLVGLIASVVPFFGDVMDLLGSLTMCLLVFIMPVMFFYKLGGLTRAPIWTRAWALFILVVGAVAMILGTLDAVRHLIEDFQKK